MTGWPVVQPGSGPEPYVDRVLDDDAYITEPKVVVAWGLVDNTPWSLTSFRLEAPLPPDTVRLGDGRVVELFVGGQGALGGGQHADRVPDGHELSLTSFFFGRARYVSAHVGVVADGVARVAAVLDDGRRQDLDLYARDGYRRAFVAFTPTDVPGAIEAVDAEGTILDRWPLALRGPLDADSNAATLAWHAE